MILSSAERMLIVIGAVVGLIAGGILTSYGWVIYNSLIGHPRVAAEARLGYVVEAEKTALEARLALEEKRREQAEALTTKHAQEAAEAEKRIREENTRLEQENAEYEERLATSGRSCKLDGADIEWLRKP